MKKIIVTTSWDDGHRFDVKLATLLKKYRIKGTFYISPKNSEYYREQLLSEKEIKQLDKDFEIGAHTMTHANLARVDKNKMRKEISESKNYLEKLLGKKVTSFCYPYGAYRNETKKIVKEVGFKLARTTKRFKLNSSDNFELNTSIHAYNHITDLLKITKFSKFNPIKIIKYLNWENLARAMFDDIYKKGGTFHLWGHSWEIDKNQDWEKLERLLKYISKKKNILHKENRELFVAKKNKKIIIVTPYFYPRTGGLENYAFNIAKGLKKKNRWNVTVITSNHLGNKKTKEFIEGIKIYRLPILFKISNTPINPMWYFDIKKIIFEEKPDVINAHSPVPFIADITASVSAEIPF